MNCKKWDHQWREGEIADQLTKKALEVAESNELEGGKQDI